MRKRFFNAAKVDLQAILNEEADRHCLAVGSFPELNNFENEPVPSLYNLNSFVPIEEVPEFTGDEEDRLIEKIDEERSLDFERGEIIPFAGTKPSRRLPEFIAIVKMVVHPERKSGYTAACFDATSGVLRLVY